MNEKTPQKPSWTALRGGVMLINWPIPQAYIYLMSNNEIQMAIPLSFRDRASKGTWEIVASRN